MTFELDQRKRDILKAIVEEYISKGEPVGSQHVARRSEVEVSPATIRAVMAELEELGYLDKPHTSAGRIPTDRGFRFFVDSMIQIRTPAARDRETIDRSVPGSLAPQAALDQASSVLHDLSQHASLVVVPRQTEGTFHHIEFVRLRDDRALAVLVSPSGLLENKLLKLDSPFTQDDLNKAANYLNELLGNLPIDSAREKIARELSDQAAIYDQLRRRALTLAEGLMADAPVDPQARLLVQGHGSLLEDLSVDVEQARAALRLLEEKKRILAVLDQVRTARQMQIFIGSESGFSQEGVSVVATPYGEGEVVGTLGVIGPTRMNYSRVIALVDYTAKALGKALAL